MRLFSRPALDPRDVRSFSRRAFDPRDVRLLVPAAFLVLLALAVAVPGLITGVDPLAADPLRALAPPGAEHWFGSDHLGRDVLSRVVYGARHSLTIGVTATALAVTAGALLGLAAGLSPKWLDETLARSPLF